MAALLTIGEFSRASYLTIKTLRHYHDVGLLEPAQVDSSSGYRYYRADQIATAQTIRRLRALEMPVEQVKGVLHAAGAGERNTLIAVHLERMEQQLERTTAAVASLRALLEEPEGEIAVEFRAVPPTPALSISAVVSLDALVSWWTAAFDELTGTLAANGLRPAGNSGALYAQEVFEQAHGEVVVFIPVAEQVTAAGRAERTHRRARRDDPSRRSRRLRSLLRRARAIPGRARPEGRGARSRVLPGRPAPHRRRQPMADRDRLAGRPDALMPLTRSTFRGRDDPVSSIIDVDAPAPKSCSAREVQPAGSRSATASRWVKRSLIRLELLRVVRDARGRTAPPSTLRRRPPRNVCWSRTGRRRRRRCRTRSSRAGWRRRQPPQ
jgi:DNA-binding transcriptional MerR regulator